MKKENAKRASEILKELESLEKYHEIMESGSGCHFEFVKRNSTQDYNVVFIDHRHNPRFLQVIRQIILELESELETL